MLRNKNLVDVVVRTDGVLQLVVDDHAGALRASAAHEQHDLAAAIGIRRLQKQKTSIF